MERGRAALQAVDRTILKYGTDKGLLHTAVGGEESHLLTLVLLQLLGDILLPRPGLCQVVALRDALPILLSQWEGAGRHKVSLSEIPLDALAPRPPQVRTIRDTVATPRLDAVVASGFSLSRSKAAALIASGKVSLNHRECLKADRPVAEGDVLTCRGLGKCVVKEVPGQSKKGRTMLVIERYI